MSPFVLLNIGTRSSGASDALRGRNEWRHGA